MKWLSLTLALAVPSEAFLRFGCATLSVQRLDPIVEPGKIPSSHVHQIVGGNAFNATMDPNVDVGETATCTTCSFRFVGPLCSGSFVGQSKLTASCSEDFSNYWTAVLYFKARNGSYKRVPQYPNALLGDLTGGMTVYYMQHDFSSNGRQKITSFKPVSFLVYSPAIS